MAALALVQGWLAASAAAGTCTVSDPMLTGSTFVTCFGDIATPIVQYPKTDLLVFSSASIATTANVDASLDARSSSNVTVYSTGTITSGANAASIIAVGANTTVTSTGPLSTSGDIAPGIYAYGQNVVINASGDISTAGYNSNGIFGVGTGVSITASGTITVKDGSGISANADSGPAIITSTSTIVSGGALSPGLYALSKSGDATVTSYGRITTTGEGSAAIAASGAAAYVTSGGSVATSGWMAPALDARAGSGPAVVTSTASAIATGENAAGIIASSKSGAATINNYGSTVAGGWAGGSVANGWTDFAFGVWLRAGTTATLNNSGTISALSGRAVDAAAPEIVVNNSGTIIGSLALRGSIATINNLADGVLESGASVDLGSGVINNSGTISPGGTGTIATTTVTGNLVQGATGRLKVDLDWQTGKADKLAVTGSAKLAGTVVVNPMNLSAGAGLTRQFTIVQAAGGVTDNGLAIANTAAVSYALLRPDANTVDVRANLNFQGTGTAGTNGSAIGQTLNTMLAAGNTLGFMPALMQLTDSQQLGSAIQQLSPQGGANAAASTLTTAGTFAGNMRSCRIAGQEGDAKATSSTDTSFYGSQLTAAYLMGFGPYYLKPQVEVGAMRLTRDAYKETGAGGVALAVQGAKDVVLSASPSLELGAEHRHGGGIVGRYFVRGGATMLDTDNFITTARFADDPAASPFSTATRIDRVVADIGAGVDLITASDTALRLQYDGQFGRMTTQHGGSAKLGIKF